jgi:predicted HicB family RNase H-like nuclease
MDNPKKIKNFSIRITEDLHQKLQQEAASQKRKTANLATLILEEYFESQDRIKKIAEHR